MQPHSKIGAVTLLDSYIYREFNLNDLLENKERMKPLLNGLGFSGVFLKNDFFLHSKIPFYLPPQTQYIKLLYLQGEYGFVVDYEIPNGAVVLNLGGMREHHVKTADQKESKTIFAYTNALYRVYDDVLLTIDEQPDICSGETYVMIFY